MIFIGPKLSEHTAHFVTNIIDSIGGENDLVIDLKQHRDTQTVYNKISSHIKKYDEQYVIYNPYEDENFFIDFKKNFPTLILIAIFSDDEWRHYNYDRFVALYADFFTIAVKDNIVKYERYGLNNVIYLRWASNPNLYYPVESEKKYDVTFVGAAYGQRIDYIKFLVRKGINVRVFGKGWNRILGLQKYWGGYLSHNELLAVVGQSKINLNFLWTSRDTDSTTIKGRTLELASCSAFQLSNETDEFINYGFEEGVNIATFNSKEDILSKINYYLSNEEERKKLAESSAELVRNNHTWPVRFEHIFARIEHGKVPDNIPSLKVLVLIRGDIKHSLNISDPRIDIVIKDVRNCSESEFDEYIGVIFLERDTTLTNESLYMMAFALYSDLSDAAIANFYISWFGKILWIRFGDKNLFNKHDMFIKLIPKECKLFSSNIAKEYFMDRNHEKKLNVTLIEYPSYSVFGLSAIDKRILKLLWGDYPRRIELKLSIKSLRLFRAFNILLDSLVQRKLR